MSIILAPVTNNQTFGTWLQRTNDIVSIFASNVVTTDSTTGGSITTGNGFVNGIFGSNTLYATYLAGGNISSNGTLTIVTPFTVANTIQVNGGATFANMVSITFSDSTVINSLKSVVGANTQVIYNNSGSANGSLALTFNNTSNTLAVNGSVATSFFKANTGNVSAPSITFTANTDTGLYNPATGTLAITAGGVQQLIANSTGTYVNALSMSSVTINNVGQMYANTYTFTGSTITAVDSFSASTYRSAEYLIEASNSTPAYQMSKLLVFFNGSTAYSTEYGQLTNAGQLVNFSVDLNGENVRLLGTPVNSGDSTVVVKLVRTTLIL